MVSYGATLALIADGGWLVSGVSSKKAVKLFQMHVSTSIVLLVRIIPVLVVFAVMGFGQGISTATGIMAVVAGMFLTVGYYLFYYSLRMEHLSTTTIVNELQPVVLVLLGTIVLGETVNGYSFVGMLMIFTGVAFVILNEGLSVNRKLLPAIIGSGSWATYWIIMTYLIQGSGSFAMPLFISQLTCIVLMLLYFVFFNRKLMHEVAAAFGSLSAGSRKALVAVGLSAMVGLGNGFADTVFSYVIQLRMVSIAGAVQALFPVIVLAFAFIAYKERLSKLQYIGTVVALAGATILTVF
ncbi:MAG: DMT family transporter [Candidatus Micrarchaeota archaeon]|nr:DMT family transporter [Candidatus Micrarchaeota archaeon]